MLKANAKLISDARFIDEDPRYSREHLALGRKDFAAYKNKMRQIDRERAAKIGYAQTAVTFDPEAPLILSLVRDHEPLLASTLGLFFDQFVHDSYAGFSKSLMEVTGYWRYRKAFDGDDTARIAGQKHDDGRAVA